MAKMSLFNSIGIAIIGALMHAFGHSRLPVKKSTV